MKLFIASVSLLSFMACVEPEEDAAVDPVARTTSAPLCAGTTITYYGWVCHLGTGGWKFQEVGHRDHACGLISDGFMVGEETDCSRGVPLRGCDFPLGQCLFDHCTTPPPMPSTPCYPGPLPPTFPGMGGGSNG